MQTVLKIACMYCHCDMGVKDGRGVTGTSHSICESCWNVMFPGEKYPVEGGTDREETKLINWITKRCPRCGREYRYPEGVRDPGCCMNWDCQFKRLHPEIKQKEASFRPQG